MDKTKICLECGKLFEKKIDCSNSNWELRKYCSRLCAAKGQSKSMKGICFNTGRTHIKKGQHLSHQTEFKKGNIPFWKGKNNPYFAGENNPRWKGGVYPEHLKIRHSVKMKYWRLKIFERDHYTCVLCSRKRTKGDRVILHADHYPITFANLLKKYKLKTYIEAKNCKKLWNIKLGRTLCRECHLKTDTHGKNL